MDLILKVLLGVLVCALVIFIISTQLLKFRTGGKRK